VTQPLPPELTRRHQPTSFADLIAAEEAQVKAGSMPGCGYRCPAGCHGEQQCIRVEHVHHGDHWRDGAGVYLPGEDRPEGAAFIAEDRVPHVGRGPDGELVQWCGPHLTAEQIAEAKAQTEADRAEATRAFLAGLDPGVLREFLAPAPERD